MTTAVIIAVAASLFIVFISVTVINVVVVVQEYRYRKRMFRCLSHIYATNDRELLLGNTSFEVALNRRLDAVLLEEILSDYGFEYERHQRDRQRKYIIRVMVREG